jgi:hypothetical protein
MFFSKKIIFIASSFFLFINNFAQDCESLLWNLNSVDSLGKFYTLPLTKLPATDNDYAYFNGIDEGVLLSINPLEDVDEFTIEAIIKPDSSVNPANKEQRFIHIRNGKNDNRRILLEIRLYPNQTWAFDTFIKSENSKCTLLDTTKTHPAGKWYHVALVYKNGIMCHFVNGIEEASGEVEYQKIENGKISVGARQDPRNWFKGTIKKIRFTKCALSSTNFLMQ